MEFVLIAFKPFRFLVLALTVAVIGCHAQTPASGQPGAKLSPELMRRIEVMIRSRSDVPAQYVISVGERTKSEVPGFDTISVTFTADGSASKPLLFLLSADGKTLAQFNKFDISQDPKTRVVAVNRPARGGPVDAPVTVIGFDDLECPYCAKMHAEIFPALLDRYKNQVHVVYLDFPLDQHPWAMRAAVDANCLAAETPSGYWNYVDYVHLHAGELGGEEKLIAKANESLDQLAMDEGVRQKIGAADLAACIKKQDDSKIKASMKQGESLGVDSTPALFVNGEKINGALPIEYVYRIIDEALRAEGQTPPPPYVPPVVTEPPAPVKPGN